MLAVNYTNLRDNMKMYMDKVTDDLQDRRKQYIYSGMSISLWR